MGGYWSSKPVPGADAEPHVVVDMQCPSVHVQLDNTYQRFQFMRDASDLYYEHDPTIITFGDFIDALDIPSVQDHTSLYFVFYVHTGIHGVRRLVYNLAQRDALLPHPTELPLHYCEPESAYVVCNGQAVSVLDAVVDLCDLMHEDACRFVMDAIVPPERADRTILTVRMTDGRVLVATRDEDGSMTVKIRQSDT